MYHIKINKLNKMKDRNKKNKRKEKYENKKIKGRDFTPSFYFKDLCEALKWCPTNL